MKQVLARALNKNLGDISPFGVNVDSVYDLKKKFRGVEISKNKMFFDLKKKELIVDIPKIRVAHKISETDNIEEIIKNGFSYKNSNIDFMDPQWDRFPEGIRVYTSLRNLIFLGNRSRSDSFILCDLYLTSQTTMFYSRCRTPPPFNHLYITKTPELLIPRFLVHYSRPQNKEFSEITPEEWNKIGFNDYDYTLGDSENAELANRQFYINNMPLPHEGSNIFYKS